LKFRAEPGKKKESQIRLSFYIDGKEQELDEARRQEFRDVMERALILVSHKRKKPVRDEPVDRDDTWISIRRSDDDEEEWEDEDESDIMDILEYISNEVHRIEDRYKDAGLDSKKAERAIEEAYEDHEDEIEEIARLVELKLEREENLDVALEAVHDILEEYDEIAKDALDELESGYPYELLHNALIDFFTELVEFSERSLAGLEEEEDDTGRYKAAREIFEAMRKDLEEIRRRIEIRQ
ncbi:MAG: hypothetical protein JSV33_00735, partial [bacterium]